MKMAKTIVKYPAWSGEHLTECFEKKILKEVTNPVLVTHPHQNFQAQKGINAYGVYAWICEQEKLEICIELANLQWWENYPHRIPQECRGNLILAWKSVVFRRSDGSKCVPYIDCGVVQPYVGWLTLTTMLMDNEVTCWIEK